MSKIQTTLGALALATMLFSCKKEIQTTQTSTIASSVASADEAARPHPSRWYGLYADGYGNGIDSLNDKDFIADGIASFNKSPFSYFYSAAKLPVKARKISCDSLKYVVRLKNPDGEAGSVFPFDVSLYLDGSVNTAYVQFLSYYQQFTALKVGNYGVTNSPNLIHQFQDWTELTLVAKKKKLAIYLDGVLTEQIDYGGTKIGTLRQLEVGFKGGGSIDWVKLYNSYTDEQVMEEDFSGPGSNVVWY